MHLKRVMTPQQCSGDLQEDHRRIGVTGLGAQQRQMCERWKSCRFALRQFGVGECVVAAMDQCV